MTETKTTKTKTGKNKDEEIKRYISTHTGRVWKKRGKDRERLKEEQKQRQGESKTVKTDRKSTEKETDTRTSDKVDKVISVNRTMGKHLGRKKNYQAMGKDQIKKKINKK